MISTIILGVIEAGPAFGIPTLSYALTIGIMAAGIFFVFRSNKMNIISPPWLKDEQPEIP
jgi:hypothetical protein|uniref:Uncharacterized protein n=1 Tax=Candidatus Aramenus sulfurataquae TaxID=1326980 RepID=A0A0F2LQZ7_9CREN